MKKASVFYRWTFRLARVFSRPDATREARFIHFCIHSFIIMSILGFVLETEPGLRKYNQGWFLLELICTIVFLTEYAARFLTCFHNRQTKLEFLQAPMNIAGRSRDLPHLLMAYFRSCSAPPSLSRTKQQL